MRLGIEARARRTATPERGSRLSKRRYLVTSAFIFGVACIASAGVALGAPQSARQGDRLITVRIGYVSVADPLMLTMIQNGTFLRNGLDVQLTKFQSGVPEVAALASNNLDIGYVATPPLVSMAARGVQVHAFAISVWNSRANGIVVGKDSGITSVAQLKGKKIATLVGSILQYSLQNVLGTAGLNVSDVQMVNVQSQLMPAALEHGDVDAAYVNQVPLLQLQHDGYNVLVRESAVPASGIGGVNLWVANDTFTSKYPLAMQKFLNAMYQTQQQLTKTPAVGASIMRNFFGLSKAQSDTLMKTLTVVPLAQQLSAKYTFNLNHGGLATQMTPVIAFMLGLQQIPASVSATSLIDAGPMTQFVAKLHKAQAAAAAKKKKKK